MRKTDLATAPNKRHARYSIDTDETRFLRGTFSIAAHRLKFLRTTKIEIIYIIPQHRVPETSKQSSIFGCPRKGNITESSIISSTVNASRISVRMTSILGTQEQKKWRSRGADPNVESF
jgi:hypothetical protein